MGVHRFLAVVVVPDDVIKVNGFCYTSVLIQLTGIGPKVRVVSQALVIALKMRVVDEVKTYKRCK